MWAGKKIFFQHYVKIQMINLCTKKFQENCFFLNFNLSTYQEAEYNGYWGIGIMTPGFLTSGAAFGLVRHFITPLKRKRAK